MSESKVVRLDHPPTRDYTDFIRIGGPVRMNLPEDDPITVPTLGEPLTLDWIYDDGGRKQAGFRGQTRDCVTRAIAIGLYAQAPSERNRALVYQNVYDELTARSKVRDARARTRTGKTSARTGVHPSVWRKYLTHLGWSWTPTMGIGTGTKVHLRPGELPAGVVIAQVSRHLVCVIDGVIHDTYDPGREGSRAVYGYALPRKGL